MLRRDFLREWYHPQWLLIGSVLSVLGVVLIMPLVAVVVQALSQGWTVYLAAITDPEALSAVRLTLLVAGIVVPLNTVFGLAVAWLLTKYSFRGKNAILTLIDLPFAVSPVIAGMVFVLLFGTQGIFGSLLEAQGLQIIYALPGIVLATLFVTVPFVARELIPFMQSLGSTEEEAALTMGAEGWRIFWKVTLPNIKWGLLHGMILCNARAMGEFGAVSVVSGHIRGMTNTLPLHVEILYNEYQFTAAFAVASLLLGLAWVTLVVKGVVEWVQRKKEIESKERGEQAFECRGTTVM